MSTESANQRRQTPSTDNSYRPGQPSGLAITAGREEPSQGPGAVGLVDVSISEAHATSFYHADDILTFQT
jgi:hypothetical protein